MTKLTERMARQRLEAAIEAAGGVRPYARMLGVSAAYVSDARLGRRLIGGVIADALKLRRITRTVTSYVEAA